MKAVIMALPGFLELLYVKKIIQILVSTVNL